MSQTLARVQQLVAEGEVRISDHGYDELGADADPEKWTQGFLERKP